MADQRAAEQPSPDEKRKLKRNSLRILVGLGALAVILAIWGVASRLIERSGLQKQTAEDAELTVTTVTAQSSNVDDELVLPGNVVAYIEAPIYARTNGYLKAWHTDIGARVRKGQLLAEIDAPEVDRELDQAKAQLDSARANAALAQTTNERWKGLVAKQAVSRQDADEKAGNATAAAAASASAQQNVARLRDLQSYKRVVAPFDGVVTARNTDVGALINAGEASGAELFRVADIHKLRVYAQVPQAYAAATRTGLKAELRFAEHPGRAFPAEAMRTSNALDPTARTLQVELQLDNRQREFFPGAYAEVHFKLPSPTKTLRVPSNTILFRPDGLQIATVDDSRKIKMKNVTQGRDFGRTVEVLDGIDEADKLVVNPSDSIENGIRVRVAPPAAKDSDANSPASDSSESPGGTSGADGAGSSGSAGGSNSKDSASRGK